MRAVVPVAALALALATGCNLTQSASPVYADFCELVPYRCDEPLARELRYTYTSSSDIKAGPDGFVSVADDTTMAEYRTTNDIALLTSEPKLSAAYAERADAASAAGDTQGALVYRDVALSAAEVEVAMSQIDQAANMISSYASAMSALGALAPVLAHSSATMVTGWVTANTGAIGASAPEGSVLHVNINKLAKATAFTTTSRIEFEVTAVLDDGRGNLLRAERGFALFTYEPDAPPSDLPANAAVVLGPTADAKLTGFESHTFEGYLTILANAAVAELDRQLGELEAE